MIILKILLNYIIKSITIYIYIGGDIMYYFAICDDDKHDLLTTKNLIINFLTLNNIEEYVIDEFNDGTSLLNSSVNYDVVLLDVVLSDDETGIDISKELTEKNEGTIVILISSSTDYLSAGYRANAKRYIMKPIDENILYSDLNDVLNSMKKDYLLFKDNDNELIRLSYKEIMYIEVLGKISTIYTVNKEYKLRKTLVQLEEKLQDSNFVRIHKSYMVNLVYVSCCKQYKIILKNRKELPLSREKQDIFKHRFMKYMGNLV